MGVVTADTQAAVTKKFMLSKSFNQEAVAEAGKAAMAVAGKAATAVAGTKSFHQNQKVRRSFEHSFSTLQQEHLTQFIRSSNAIRSNLFIIELLCFSPLFFMPFL